MKKLDPRRNAFRADLAAERLRGVVEAARFVSGVRRQVNAPSLPLRREPRMDAVLETEALHGETLIAYDEREGWTWCQLEYDGYVGYMPSEGLAAVGPAPTHRVSALRTYVFPEPDSKAPPLAMLSLNAQVRAFKEADGYLQLATGGFVYEPHLATLGAHAEDFVTIAEAFVGAPYLWGGRTSVGLDCSGLVQLAAAAAGHDVPRDADMQEAEAGEPVDWREGDPLQRGDLVFWEGHVGIMTGIQDFLHANAYHMAVAREPFETACHRIKSFGLEVARVRRLPPKS